MAPRTTSEATHPTEPGGPTARSRVEVRIVAEDPEAARLVADALRTLFTGGEQRSYPASHPGTGTRLHLTLDTAHTGDPHTADPLRSWLNTSRPSADQAHADETD
ncbi:hypothetical protein OG866_20720 [Streptomyces sp. NBC_00663]|uniref:hypothetical protein n=1 Tax=Streptomyces sp. NBC_00663 TaxID=2975801 RepID=UPI002E375A2F|nr:hypothetical protein [Streptomyces sp. NBC_00663]